MTKSSTPRPTMAQSKSPAITLPDGTITEHHPGTSFTTLNGNTASTDEEHTVDGSNSIKVSISFGAKLEASIKTLCHIIVFRSALNVENWMAL